ncbi:hypothetical protein EWM64_g9405 [Hericium alpestre]|uniref:BTB domain-containing protein n=1 Tax=Hericium alpestre TaxID=135208 RepID=A0A4Y9ZKP8_9AGAM|nr:hypothetical protein EWM64_g9405 [Hericium alpestre]
MVLFAASIYVLVWHQPNRRNLIISVALFVFTTVDFFLDYSLTILSPSITSQSLLVGGAYAPCPGADLAARAREGSIYDLLNLISDGTYTINFVLADGLLISRCITMWSRTRWIIIPLGLMLAGTTACNLASIYYDSVVYMADKNPGASESELLHNVALDSRFLEVGDILSLATTWLRRLSLMTKEIESGMGRKAGVRYRAAMAMVIESGALFSTSLVTSLASAYASANFDIAEVFVAMLMGIAPTLIIVRVGMGKGFDTVQYTARESSSAGYSSTPRAHQFADAEMSRIRFQTVESSVSDVGRESKLVTIHRPHIMITCTPDDDQKPRDYGSPFNDSDADVIFRSFDQVDFYLYKNVLAKASSVFRDMFSVPQPGRDTTGPRNLPTVSLSETSTDLAMVLKFCCPFQRPALTVQDAAIVLRIAEKYAMDWLYDEMKDLLKQPAMVQEHPIKVFALAWDMKLEDVARVAAKEFLRVELTLNGLLAEEEMESISGSALRHLALYHRRCSDAAQRQCKPGGTSWTSSCPDSQEHLERCISEVSVDLPFAD